MVSRPNVLFLTWKSHQKIVFRALDEISDFRTLVVFVLFGTQKTTHLHHDTPASEAAKLRLLARFDVFKQLVAQEATLGEFQQLLQT